MSTLYSAIQNWIPQPGRITRSWSSGLVLLQQNFIGHSNLGPVANDGDAFPANAAGTGAKVYGVPEYSDLENGLQNATVSAYGIVPGKNGLKTLTNKKFITIRVGFFARKQFVNSEGGLDGYNFVKYNEIIVTLNTYERPFFNSSNLEIIPAPTSDDFEMIAPYQIGSVAAGTSLLTKGFKVSDIFPRITSNWQGNHNERLLTKTIMQSKDGFQFESYGDVSVVSSGFVIWPENIDFGNFLAPDGYSEPIQLPGEGYAGRV